MTDDNRRLAHLDRDAFLLIVQPLRDAYPDFEWRALLLVADDPLETSLRVECLAAKRTGICDLTPASMLNDIGPAAQRRLITSMGRDAIVGWLEHEVDK